jgi:hypothetical protein
MSGFSPDVALDWVPHVFRFRFEEVMGEKRYAGDTPRHRMRFESFTATCYYLWVSQHRSQLILKVAYGADF